MTSKNDGIPPEIRFTFEGVQYKCSLEAYNTDRIILPDGRILAVGNWIESHPPHPIDLRIIGKVLGTFASKV